MIPFRPSQATGLFTVLWLFLTPSTSRAQPPSLPVCSGSDSRVQVGWITDPVSEFPANNEIRIPIGWNPTATLGLGLLGLVIAGRPRTLASTRLAKRSALGNRAAATFATDAFGAGRVISIIDLQPKEFG